jgi:hypothetical protein
MIVQIFQVMALCFRDVGVLCYSSRAKRFLCYVMITCIGVTASVKREEHLVYLPIPTTNSSANEHTHFEKENRMPGLTRLIPSS